MALVVQVEDLGVVAGVASKVGADSVDLAVAVLDMESLGVETDPWEEVALAAAAVDSLGADLEVAPGVVLEADQVRVDLEVVQGVGLEAAMGVGSEVVPGVGLEGVGMEADLAAAQVAAQAVDLEAEMEVDLVAADLHLTAISSSRLEILDLDLADLQVSLINNFDIFVLG